MPAEVKCLICITQTHRPKQTHVTLMESSQAELTLENPRGINKNKGSLFRGILPIHILRVKTIYEWIIIASTLPTAWSYYLNMITKYIFLVIPQLFEKTHFIRLVCPLAKYQHCYFSNRKSTGSFHPSSRFSFKGNKSHFSDLNMLSTLIKE